MFNVSIVLLLNDQSKEHGLFYFVMLLPLVFTLVSKDGTFELSFFNLDSSSNRYIGIWFKNILIRAIVWCVKSERSDPFRQLVLTSHFTLHS
ncbi:hypothetical protein RJT34_23331 [Clitoria ternatea]|uniref:Uncharacterized protein n=1 Tax=Clitoria ternatea TaxID=43366 RepID=A0AAN9IIB6_CLITE